MTVLTCSARREYFAATMASIQRAGGDAFVGRKVVFIDGADQLTLADWEWYAATAGSGWTIKQTDPHGLMIGTKPSMLAILHAAADAKAEKLIYLEDDIVLCKNAIPALERIKFPEHIAFLSFCDIKNIAPKMGITECVGYDFEGPTGEGGHWGNQMLLIPGASLQYLRSTATMPDWGLSIPDLGQHWPKTPEDIRLPKKASDIMLGITLALPPAPWTKFGVFAPSLSQHIGERSLVQGPTATATGYGRDSLTWQGEDFDALTLNLETHELHEAIPRWRADKKTKYNIRFRGNVGRKGPKVVK